MMVMMKMELMAMMIIILGAYEVSCESIDGIKRSKREMKVLFMKSNCIVPIRILLATEKP